MSSSIADPPRVRRRVVRSDIQALRAVAVLLVVLDHVAVLQMLPGHPEGGFIGVDVFFVISGFLITQHLLSDVLTKGRVDFGQFYRRRFRRILPMALLVIAVTVAASFMAFWPWQAQTFSIDGIWAALFVSNIAFAARGVDYFASEHASVFQHYWSLSVEEQFYLVWPLIIAGAGLFATRKIDRRRWILLTAIAVGAASFAWACFDTYRSPAEAYFSTFTRGFEFAIGGAIAIAAPSLGDVPRTLRRGLSLLGILGIGASVWIVNPIAGFPGPMALFPAITAGLFIAAGTGTGERISAWPLTARPITYIGDISYSLYLWHWPVIMFLDTFIPRDWVVIPGALVLSFALSALSHRYVEQTVLKSGWLRGGANAATRPKAAKLHALRAFARNASIMAVGILSVVAVIGIGDAAVRAIAASRTDGTSGGSLTLQTQPVEALVLVEKIQNMVDSSRHRGNWSDLRPDIADIGVYSGELSRDCWTWDYEQPKSCTRGNPDAPFTIAVLGDSIAMNSAFAVDEFVRINPAWKLSVYAKLGCAAPDVPQLAPDGSSYDSCVDFRTWAVKRIAEQKPDVVWITSALPTNLPGVPQDEMLAVWESGMRSTLERLTDIPRILVVAPPPAGRDLSFCSRPFNKPADCATSITKAWLDIDKASRTATQAMGRTYVDTGMWFCTVDGYCPAVIGDYIVRRDERHLTYDYGVFLGPLVAAWVNNTAP